jgi:hypothetical protein
VRDVANHATFVDEQSGENGEAAFFNGDGLPEGFAGVGDDAGAESEASDIVFGDTARE